MAVSVGGDPAALRRRGPVVHCGRVGSYFTEGEGKSQLEVQMAMTPLTFFERTLGSLSQSHGMAAAVSVICSSSLPHASARALGSEISWALAMPALIFGSLSCGQFELFTGTMFLPLNGTSSQASPS